MAEKAEQVLRSSVEDNRETRVLVQEQTLHNSERQLGEALSDSRSAAHNRLEEARKKRKDAAARAAAAKENATSARHRSQLISGTTVDEHAAHKAEEIARRAAREVEMLLEHEKEMHIPGIATVDLCARAAFSWETPSTGMCSTVLTFDSTVLTSKTAIQKAR